MPRPDTPSFPRLDRPAGLTTQVEQMLRQAIAEGRFPSGRLPTEVELAKHLGVSRETVRLAAETLQREGLLVKVRRKGTFLQAPQLPDRIDMLPSLGYLQASYPAQEGEEEVVTRQVSALMLQGAVEQAALAGYSLLVLHAPYTRIGEALRRARGEQGLRGLIFAHCGEEKLVRRAVGLGLPTVLLDHDLQRTQVPSVRDDSIEAARLAIRHLAGLGHRRIAFLNWRQEDLNPWRLQGYRQGLRDQGLPRRRAWEIATPLTRDGAREAIRQFLKLSPRPTAVYCFNNSLANLAMSELRDGGIQVPEQVSVMGGGGEEVPGLTCHQADWHRMGRLGIQILLQALDPQNRQDIENRLVPHTLQTGLTAMAPPGC